MTGKTTLVNRHAVDHLRDSPYIGVTATVYAHVRLRLQRDAIDTLSTALDVSPGTVSVR